MDVLQKVSRLSVHHIIYPRSESEVAELNAQPYQLIAQIHVFGDAQELVNLAFIVLVRALCLPVSVVYFCKGSSPRIA